MPKQKLKELGIEHQRRFSPVVEKMCLTISANESFLNAEKDIELFSGISISKNTIHRIIERYEEPEENICKEEVSEIAIDAGSVCLRNGKCQQFKVANINKHTHIACFKNDKRLIEKLEKLTKKEEVYILGDGHDGVWNISRELTGVKHEILDWYHLMENLHKQNFSEKCLELYKKHLWHGEKEKVINELKLDNNFRKYLEKHRERLINYNEHQKAQLSSIGSGAVESSVKQIKTRTNIAGARWSKKGVRQILSVRTAYLNGSFSY